MLSGMFIILEWIAQITAETSKVTLMFTDQKVIDYNPSAVVLSTSEFVTVCRNFKEINNVKTNKNTIEMNCSSETFDLLRKLIDEEKTENWDDITNTFTLNIVYKILNAMEHLQYEDKTRNLLHERLLEHVFPKIVYSFTNERQKNECIKSSSKFLSVENVGQIGLILSLYLSRLGLGIRIDENIATVCRNPKNKYLTKIPKAVELSELRIHPEVLICDIEEKDKTDKKQKLGIMLWLFNESMAIPALTLNGCFLTDGYMEQLSTMKHLKTLQLKECTLKLDKDYKDTETGFEALEDLNISGMKLDERIDSLLCRITKLRLLTMEKCFIKPEIKLEFIRKQADLKELRIGQNNLSEEHLDAIFSHESIRVLNMDKCTVDDIYIYKGKVENFDILKIFNNGKLYIKEGEIRVIFPRVNVRNNKRYFKRLKTYNDRLVFFEDDCKMIITKPKFLIPSSIHSKICKSNSRAFKLKELNGSTMTFGNNDIRITLPKACNILKKLEENLFNGGQICFNGNGKVNFVGKVESDKFMKNVEEFSCGQVYFEDKQIELILSYNKLKILNMRQCGLESEMIMKLESKTELEELDLSNNNMIGEEDMVQIIRKCPKLRKLSLNGCRMLVTGDFKDAPVLENLEELNIGGNKLNGDCCKYIFKHLKLIKLNFEDSGLVEDSLDGIESLKELKELYVGDNFIGKQDFDRIFKLKKLEVLNMSHSRLFGKAYEGGIDIDNIKELSMLKTLDIGDNNLSRVGISEIFELEKLEYLRPDNCGLTRGMLCEGNKLINLVKLSIEGNIIDKDDMDAIAKLKKLKGLRICNCDISGERVFENIGQLKDSLISFDAANCRLLEENMMWLSELTNLRELRLLGASLPFAPLCVVLKGLTCLKGLYLGIIDSRKFIDCNVSPLVLLYTLEILELKCIYIQNEFIKTLSKLVNLKELTLKCIGNCRNVEISSLNISAFPKNLCKLKVSGEWNNPVALQSNGEEDDVLVFYNLKELSLSNIWKISGKIIKKIGSCSKLGKFRLQMDSCTTFRIQELKEIEKIDMLEELILVKVDLSSENKIRLSCLKNLRQVCLLYCNLNKKYLRDIEKIRSLEVLNILGNKINSSMNGILGLKNLRELSVQILRFDYGELGIFSSIKGFEKLGYSKWKVYKNNKQIKYENPGFNNVVTEMKKEVTLKNWKGVTELNNWYIDVNSAIFLAISSKLVFVKRIYLNLPSTVKLNEDNMEILENCLMLREIIWKFNDNGQFLSIPDSIINEKPMLQLVNMPINDLSVKFSNLLLKCRYLHTIRLNTQKYENGFFAVLLKEPEKSLVRHIGVCFEYKSWCFSQNIFENSTEYVNEEMIIRYVDKKDKDAITEARERGVYVGLRFFIN